MQAQSTFKSTAFNPNHDAASAFNSSHANRSKNGSLRSRKTDRSHRTAASTQELSLHAKITAR